MRSASGFALVPAELVPGDILLVHTDGVMEGLDDLKRFELAVAAAEQTGAAREADALAALAITTGAATVLADDQTMLIIERTGAT